MNRIPSVLSRAQTATFPQEQTQHQHQQQQYHLSAGGSQSAANMQLPRQNSWSNQQQQQPRANNNNNPQQLAAPLAQQQQEFGTLTQSSVYSRGDVAAVATQPQSAPPSVRPSSPYIQSAAPLPSGAFERLSSAPIDREALRPGANVVNAQPTTAGRYSNSNVVGYTNPQQQQSRTIAFVSPARENFRRGASPVVSWTSSAIPRFRYEPPPMIPSYHDVERLALTPVKETRRGEDIERQRIPAEDRWGVPVRRIPNRFNSVPSDSRESEFEDDNGYAKRVARDETPRSRRERLPPAAMSPHGNPERYDVDRRSERRSHHHVSRGPYSEDIVVTPRERHESRRSRRNHGFEEVVSSKLDGGTPRREDRPSRYDHLEPYERRYHNDEERRHRHRDAHHHHYRREQDEDLGLSPVRERSGHRSSRHHHRRDEVDTTVMSDEYRAVDERAERHRRKRAARLEDVQSPDSYVVGSSKLGQLIVDVEPVRRTSPSSSRRRSDESEEQYRARRRAEREQRRMMAR